MKSVKQKVLADMLALGILEGALILMHTTAQGNLRARNPGDPNGTGPSTAGAPGSDSHAQPGLDPVSRAMEGMSVYGRGWRVASSEATVTRRKAMRNSPNQRSVPLTRKKDRATVPAGQPSARNPSETQPRDTLLPRRSSAVPQIRGRQSFDASPKPGSGGGTVIMRRRAEPRPSLSAPSTARSGDKGGSKTDSEELMLIREEYDADDSRSEMMDKSSMENAAPGETLIQSEGGPQRGSGVSQPESAATQERRRSNNAGARAFLEILGARGAQLGEDTPESEFDKPDS